MIDFGFGVKLDSLKIQHREKYREWRNDHRVYKWCRQRDLISELDQDIWFNWQNESQTTKMYEIYTDSGSVGVCGLTSIDQVNQTAEFSLYIGPEFQRNGYAKMGLKTLCKHAFMNLNINCVWGETYNGNPAYVLFEKIGFKLDGVGRQRYFREGKFIDVKYFSLLRQECLF